MVQNVLVPYDGSDLSKRALEVGIALSKRVGVDVRVLVFPADSDDPSPSISRELATAATEHGIEPVIISRQRLGTVADEVLIEVAAVDDPLVCIGSHGRARSAAYFGSVATDLLQASTEPVLVCGPNVSVVEPTSLLAGPTVVAVDMSEGGRNVTPIAKGWVGQFEQDLETVTVHDGGFGRSEKAANVARSIVAECSSVGASVLVMATHAPSGRQRFLEPSVTSEVVKRISIPVLAAGPLVSM
ncbi:MAG: universal stress protein [Acidimicrobiales bacterium]|nr:universal stress protein [Acidimicrobiales bacterium]